MRILKREGKALAGLLERIRWTSTRDHSLEINNNILNGLLLFGRYGELTWPHEPRFLVIGGRLNTICTYYLSNSKDNWKSFGISKIYRVVQV